MNEAENRPKQAPPDYRLHLTDADWQSIFDYVRKHPQVLFHERTIRNLVARRRAEAFGQVTQWEGESAHMIDGADRYNRAMMKYIPEAHVLRLLRPLSIIDPVYSRAHELKVLSIGPRSENELFQLYAHGFQPWNVSAIDIVSNSPLIRIADMHDIPFPPRSFDVVVSGWTLPYSRDARRAIREKVRVTKDGGLLCIGLTRVPDGDPGMEKLIKQKAAIYMSSDQIIADIGASVGEVAFRHDPVDKSQKGGIMVIVRIRKSAG